LITPPKNIDLKKNGIYIALEGIKGCGKSTIVNRIYRDLIESGIKTAMVAPTRVGKKLSFYEIVSRYFSVIRKIDKWNELLYARRSNNSINLIKGDEMILLGDRSIMTSYVYRWKKWSNYRICVERVNNLENNIPSPDHILFLDIDPIEALRRIKLREKRDKCYREETIERLTESYKNYLEVMNSRIEKLNNTKIHFINANQPLEMVYNDVQNKFSEIINIFQRKSA